ncbi:aminoglycoside phosphotransferase family protein [bacterium]|nr:MAG: aminoglycoside phosphotransferase family protein [bacterium]
MQSQIPSEHLLRFIQESQGATPVDWSKPSGGHTEAERWIITLDDGRTLFAKAAVDGLTAGWLNSEFGVYSQLDASYLPGLIAFHPGELPIMLLEDLSSGDWPPPWDDSKVRKVMNTLELIANTVPPSGLITMEEAFRSSIGGWRRVQEDPSGLLSLGLCSRGWLEKVLPIFIEAEESCSLSGESLVQADIRSDNICFFGDRTVVVDWNHACIGNPMLDLIGWLPTLYFEGGPPPWEINTSEKGLISLLSGYYASSAYKPEPRPDSTIRQLHFKCLKASLPWMGHTFETQVY